MFLEDEDWNDGKIDVPSPGVTSPKENSSPNVKAKVVGKKSLLRTLQILGSVPEWKSEEREKSSDSETKHPSTEHSKKRRKKHRRKRRHGETEEQTESTELSQGATQDTDPPKRSKKDRLEKKVNSKATDSTKDLEIAKPGKEPAEDQEKKLSRQQWKNRMKNKRKYKNKFQPKEAASEKRERKETDCNDNITSHNSQADEVSKKKCNKEKLKSSDEMKQRNAEFRKIIKDKLQVSEKTQKCEQKKKAQLKKEKLRKLLQTQEAKEDEAAPVEEVDTEKEAVSVDIHDPSASLRSRMEQRLESARFRYINEMLYSSTSREASRMFTQDPQAFWVYHRGYSTQVQRWPNNPVDNIIQFIRKKPSSLVVADFGCGDCKIAKSVKNKVHCFDLVATCELVTACDMANVPLKDSSVDIAVFCLSLMGTNLADFLKEANRVLKKGGFLKIAEVSSRFDNVRGFLTALAGLGFKMVSKNTENSHFYSFDFVKTGPAPENVKKLGLQLKPCVYKKR